MASTFLQCGRFQLPLDRPLVMGILNVTPDSFSDGGRFRQRDQAVRHAETLIAAGADMIDIGGESTRPNADPVSLDEERDRVLPVIEQLLNHNIPLSLDTRRTAVMKAALSLGVDLINDISALEDDGALALLATSSAAVCLMHKKGEPQTMQAEPHYHDVVSEVADYLQQRVDAACAHGIAPERLLIDPGFGFGKNLAHNYTLLAQLQRFSQIAPVLAGLSRKSMLGAVLGGVPPIERVAASVGAAVMAAERGAVIIRVHDVKETCDALAVWSEMRRYSA